MHPKARTLALITGASSGIGAEFARQLAARGHDVLLIARRTDRLQALAAQLEQRHPISATCLTVDLHELDAFARIAAEVRRLGRPLTWLINNAGYGQLGPFASFSIEAHRGFIRVLGQAPVELTHELLPELIEAAPAHVINVASVAAFLPGTANLPLYTATKSFLVKFSEMLAAELKGKGVTVTASCPGLTESELLDRHGPEVDVSRLRKRKAMPASRVVSEALDAAEAGRVSIVHGARNKLVVGLLRLFPGPVSRLVTRR